MTVACRCSKQPAAGRHQRAARVAHRIPGRWHGCFEGSAEDHEPRHRYEGPQHARCVRGHPAQVRLDSSAKDGVGCRQAGLSTSGRGKILRGKKPDAIIAAAIYVACKMNHVPRTFPRSAARSPACPRSTLASASRDAAGVRSQCYGTGSVDGSRVSADNSGTSTPIGIGPTGAADLVGRYCNHLGLEMRITRSTEDITARVRELGILAGRSPITIAAACIYFSTLLWGVDKGAKRISQAAGCGAT